MSKDVQVVAGRMKMISDDETKRQIVKESYESDLSMNRFAKERGISAASLCMWRKKYAPAQGPVSDDIETLRTENENLKRELVKIKAYLGHKIYQFEGMELT